MLRQLKKHNSMKAFHQLLALGLLAMPAGLLAQDTEIWVSRIDNPNRETNGIYGFPASDPQAITAKKTAPELYFQKGVGYQDGVIYGMDYKQGFFSPDRYILYAVDTKTWSISQRDVDKMFAIKETANGVDGTVYALFDDGALGTIDYVNLTRQDISSPSRYYVALGVSSIGELFGIDSEANMVRINTQNGAETVVGNLGISINRYSQTTGEIDPVTNLFYLAAKTSYGEPMSIFAIDLQTCEATTKGQLPYGYEDLAGMIIVGEPAAAGAPGRATGLKATFEGNSLTGTLSFTAPTETFDHKELEGELAYTVSYGADVQQTLSGTAQAGADVSLPITLSEGGLITFSVKFANTAGEGQTASVTQWVGPDAPLTPADVELTLDADGKATLTWSAPTACLNGGHLGNLTYDVRRIVSGEETLVAQGLTATMFTEQLEITTLQEYSYTVTALNDGTPSEPATSNRVVAGDGFGVPFVEQFGEGNHLEYFTVVNVNGDSDRWGDLTWKLHTEMTYWGQGKSYEEMWVQTDGATDDWLLTPPLQLQPGQAYIVKFKMKAGYDSTPETFEVMMGRTASVGAMTTTLLREQSITNTTYTEFSREFSVSEAGSYCIGFHATPNQGSALYLDDIEVRVNASQAAPAKVADLAAEADATGELRATVSFTAPTTTIGGDALTELTKIEVMRDATLIAVIEAPAVGSSQQVVDEHPSNGYHLYTVVAYNAEGNGLRAETPDIYVGVDIPQAPVVTKIADQGDHVVFEWAESAATGARGYVVRPEDVVYEVYATDMATGRRADLIYEGKDRMVEASYSDTEDFDVAKWIIVARNVAGSSSDAAAKIATGTPLTLPYRETFAMGRLKTSIWTEQTGMRSWNPSTEDACDADAGSLMFAPYADGDQSSYNTQRLTFVGVKQPQLSFWYRIESGSLAVKAWLSDGSEMPLLDAQSSASSASQWCFATTDMSPLKQQPYVVLKFQGTGQAESRLFVDNVLVCDGAYANGIKDTVQPSLPNGHYYDIQGRRVAEPAQGLYIYNGKKIIK